MKFRTLASFACLLLGLAVAGGAAAAPITMDPGAISIANLTGGDAFVITFDGGDTADNVLHFTAAGAGGFATGAAVVVFEGTDIIGAGDSVGGFFNEDNVVRGIPLLGTGVAAALMLDAGPASAESFFLAMDSTPTYATIFSLDLDMRTFARLTADNLHAVLAGAIDKQRVRFDTPGAAVPEPSAALVFGVGLLVTGHAIRRRR